MGIVSGLLTEFRDLVSDPFHKGLVEAYLESPGYEALLNECKRTMEARIDEIETTHRTGNAGLPGQADG